MHLACAECDEMFPDETSLEIHCERMHVKDENPFACGEGEQNLLQKTSLDEHHTGVHGISCSNTEISVLNSVPDDKDVSLSNAEFASEHSRADLDEKSSNGRSEFLSILDDH